MRVIRSAGQNVSPSDDGRLFDQIFDDGLFVDTTITHLGTNNVSIGALYGIICGRDFTAEAQTVQVELPESDTATGYIYVEIDTSSDDVITIGSALAPFTPTYEDINTNGAVAQMIIAEYEASAVAVTSITAKYPNSGAGTERSSQFTIYVSNWSGTKTTVDGADYYTYTINLSKVFTDHPTIGIGAAGTLPTEAEQTAYDAWQYVTVDKENLTLKLYSTEVPASNFVIIAKGVE